MFGNARIPKQSQSGYSLLPTSKFGCRTSILIQGSSKLSALSYWHGNAGRLRPYPSRQSTGYKMWSRNRMRSVDNLSWKADQSWSGAKYSNDPLNGLAVEHRVSLADSSHPEHVGYRVGYVGSPLPGATRYRKASRTRLINSTDYSLGAFGSIRSIHRG